MTTRRPSSLTGSSKTPGIPHALWRPTEEPVGCHWGWAGGCTTLQQRAQRRPGQMYEGWGRESLTCSSRGGKGTRSKVRWQRPPGTQPSTRSRPALTLVTAFRNTHQQCLMGTSPGSRGATWQLRPARLQEPTRTRRTPAPSPWCQLRGKQGRDDDVLKMQRRSWEIVESIAACWIAFPYNPVQRWVSGYRRNKHFVCTLLYHMSKFATLLTIMFCVLFIWLIFQKNFNVIVSWVTWIATFGPSDAMWPQCLHLFGCQNHVDTKNLFFYIDWGIIDIEHYSSFRFTLIVLDNRENRREKLTPIHLFIQQIFVKHIQGRVLSAWDQQ